MRAVWLVSLVAAAALACSSLHGTTPGGGDDAGSTNHDVGQGGGNGGNGNDGSSSSSAPDGGAGGERANCSNASDTCICSADSSGNGAPCSAGSLGVDASAVLCCADPNYPSLGSCTCQWIGCTASNGDCTCGPGNGHPGGSCASSSWTCCIQSSAPGCLCASIACQDGYSPLGSACQISDLTCPGAQHAVTSCN